MKRYKQSILSNFFVTHIIETDGTEHKHLVEANLDIESRADRTLCTEVLHGAIRHEVLTNTLLIKACPICAAILDRRISNMPKERKASNFLMDHFDLEVPDSQLAFELPEELEEESLPDDSGQFELF